VTADALISSYLGHGTHAARPATPNVAAGVVAIYYETDTLQTFIWDGAAWQALGFGGAADFAQAQYVTASITLGTGTTTDGAYVDVDATNAAIAFTPAAAGKYRVTFTFSHYLVGTGIDMFFRMTDGTTPSTAFERSVAAGDSEVVITLSYIYTWTAVAKTVKLQKRIVAAGATTSNIIPCSATAGVGIGLYVAVERIGS
jgi:hypothetical protein